MAEVGQRKTVTVLFADLVDSTALAEQTDPEALAELLSEYFAAMRSVIERHGGTVEKFIGDAVVGMFGVPDTHEDDALRAVRAALGMQSATEELNVGFEARGRPTVSVRIGINTGEVAVTRDGRGSEGQLALGHAVNMAARLEQAAGAGEVLIGARTYELAGASVVSERLNPMAVKGSTAPIAAWKVIETVDGRPTGWDREGLFVGREKELALVDSAFATAEEQQAFVVVTVVAPPGMGKSRLAAEAANRVGDRAQILVGRCLPYGEGVTYAPLLEIATSSNLPDNNEVIELARRALSDTALASPEETAWAFKQVVDSLAERLPVFAVVDDLHWAEPLLLDVLDYVATLSTGRPILLLCLSRPDLLDNRPEWAVPRQHSFVIRMEPLTADETNALLATNDALAADPHKRREILEAAAGVPLFIEQIAALRLEGESGIPPTVRALLAARVDRLKPPDRAVLERAAIQGEVFDRATVAAMLGDTADVGLGARLLGLVRREFIRPERSADGDERFRFSHALLRDAVYEQMAHRLRSQLHERYAELLALSDADSEVIGHHLERAYAERAVMGASDEEATALAMRAGTALHDAGRRALARKEWQHGRDVLERARALLEHGSEAAVGVLVDLIHAFGELADWDRAEAVFREAVHSARLAADGSAELRAEMVWASLQARRGYLDWQERIPELADRAVEHFSSNGSERDLASALLLKANPVGAADLAASIESLRQAQTHADAAGDEQTQIEIWDELGGVMIFGPTPYDEILEFGRREIAWARERGIAFTEADGLLAEAYAIAALGDAGEARRRIAEVREMFAQLPGFVSQLGESDTLAASIERDSGNLAAAESFYRRALETTEKGEHALWWRAAALGLADVLVDLGRQAEAEGLLDEIDRRGLTWGVRPRSRYLQARAKLAMAAGDTAGALKLAREAVEVLTDIQAFEGEARAREVLGDLLAQAGDKDGSVAAWQRSRDLYAAKRHGPGERRVTSKLS